MSRRFCPDVVPYRSLSKRQTLARYDYSSESEEKKSYTKENKSIEQNKRESAQNYESYLRDERSRDSNSYRDSLQYGPARKGRFGSRRDMPAISESGRRESRKRESMATISRGRRRFTIGRI